MKSLSSCGFHCRSTRYLCPFSSGGVSPSEEGKGGWVGRGKEGGSEGKERGGGGDCDEAVKYHIDELQDRGCVWVGSKVK